MRFEIIVLGTSAAVPAHGRYCSGQLLCLEQESILIDCGEGTQYQLQRSGEGSGKISHILITHLHGDHYFGLPGLLMSMALADRKRPLTIVSPPGLRQRLAGVLELDVYPLSFPVNFLEKACDSLEMIIESKHFTVAGFPLAHRVVTNGYLVRETKKPDNLIPEAIQRYGIPVAEIAGIKAGADFVTSDGERIAHTVLTKPAAEPRSFAYCSDTLYSPAIVPYISGVDLLYHEATFLHDQLEKAVKTGHSTALQAGMIAAEAGVGRLMIGHYSARYAELDALLREASSAFPNTVPARELYHYLLPFSGR